MRSDVRLDARAATSTYVLLGSIFGLFFGASLAARSFSLTIFLSIVGVFGVVWIRRYRIIVDCTSVTYVSLSGGRVSTRLDDIASARTAIRPRGSSGSLLRLELELTSPKNSQINIDMKVFSRMDLKCLFELLHEKIAEPPRLSIFGRE
jgi:hypothetical protein